MDDNDDFFVEYDRLESKKYYLVDTIFNFITISVLFGIIFTIVIAFIKII